MSKPIYILGTGLSHDGSACLLKDGKIAVAIEKERITRKKHDGGNDSVAIQYCLEAEGIELKDVALIVQNANFGSFEYGSDYFYGPRLFTENVSVPIVTISHHLAHAYSAVGISPFDKMAVLVIDGCGSLFDECIDLDGAEIPLKISENFHLYAEKDSYYYYDGQKLKTLYKDFSPMGLFFKNYPMHPKSTQHSIGGIYGAVSEYIFGDMMDAGKLMGLAPYGKQDAFAEKIFNYDNGRVFLNYDWMPKFKKPSRDYNQFKQNFQDYANIAKWVQKQIEEAVLYIVNERYKFFGSDNLAYTGGVALNAVANEKIIKNSSFKQVYITPAAGDNGLAIGCAFYGWLEVLKKPRIIHDQNTYFGKTYSSDTIQNSIANHIAVNGDNKLNHDVLTELFNSLSTQKLSNKVNDCKILFLIHDYGVKLVTIKSNQIQVRDSFDHQPDCIVTCDSRSLIQSLNNGWLDNPRVSNKPLQISGNESVLRQIDWGKARSVAKKAISNPSKVNLKYKECDDIAGEAALLLSQGKIIGWYQEGCEFGPRALGHRSILADPRNPSFRNHINKNIKFREDFRPFAPSVLAERASDFFELSSHSPYMILVAQANDKCRSLCPSIVHEDGTSRIQTVTETGGLYYKLIKKFSNITGIPILLNTSLNRKGQPIVETPSEAISFFTECALDNLVIGNILISK